MRAALGGGLRGGGVLPGQRGGLRGLVGPGRAWSRSDWAAADSPGGFVPGPADRRVAVGFGGGDPICGVSPGLRGTASRSASACGPGLPRPGSARCLGGGQLGGHLLGGGVGFGAPLVGLGCPLLGGGGPGLGGGGALLGGGPGGFDFGLGGGRVGYGRDRVAELPGDACHPVGFGAQQA